MKKILSIAIVLIVSCMFVFAATDRTARLDDDYEEWTLSIAPVSTQIGHVTAVDAESSLSFGIKGAYARTFNTKFSVGFEALVNSYNFKKSTDACANVTGLMTVGLTIGDTVRVMAKGGVGATYSDVNGTDEVLGVAYSVEANVSFILTDKCSINVGVQYIGTDVGKDAAQHNYMGLVGFSRIF